MAIQAAKQRDLFAVGPRSLGSRVIDDAEILNFVSMAVDMPSSQLKVTTAPIEGAEALDYERVTVIGIAGGSSATYYVYRRREGQRDDRG